MRWMCDLQPPITTQIHRSDADFVLLSVDVPLKELLHEYIFEDEGSGQTKKCVLCNDVVSYDKSHINFVPHIAREGILTEILRAYCGQPKEVVERWWRRLDCCESFPRIRELSSDDSSTRRKNLLHVLKFLKERHILRECFSVVDCQQPSSAGRSWEFERLEWVGDSVVKYLFNDRITVMFPMEEGGVVGKLSFFQNLIDGNNGLARAYDYLQLEQLTESDKVISKFKSDVVEAVFGELQVYIWSTQYEWETASIEFPLSPELLPIRALVAHAMHELAHVMIMFHVESVLESANYLLQRHSLEVVRADPEMRKDKMRRASTMAGAHAARKHNYSMELLPEKVSVRLLPVSLHHLVEPFPFLDASCHGTSNTKSLFVSRAFRNFSVEKTMKPLHSSERIEGWFGIREQTVSCDCVTPVLLKCKRKRFPDRVSCAVSSLPLANSPHVWDEYGSGEKCLLLPEADTQCYIPSEVASTFSTIMTLRSCGSRQR